MGQNQTVLRLVRVFLYGVPLAESFHGYQCTIIASLLPTVCY